LSDSGAGQGSMGRYWCVLIFGLVVWLPATAAAQVRQPNRGANAGQNLGQNPGQAMMQEMMKQQEKMFRAMMGGRDDVTDAQLAKVSVSLDEEKKFGKQVEDYYLGTITSRGYDLVESGTEVEYLRQLIDSIRDKNQIAKKYKTLRVILAESPDIDAMTIVGGLIVVHRGLLDFVENEAELAGVLGHELSHLERGHLTRPIRRAKYFEKNVASGGGFSMDKMASMFDLMRDQFLRPFRPEDETQADRDGATWIHALGYDPRALARMFARVGQRKADAGAVMIPFLKSHPAFGERERDILATYDDLQKKKPKKNLELGVKNLADRKALFGKNVLKRAP
jgi:predicted Zn-dependent protease